METGADMSKVRRSVVISTDDLKAVLNYDPLTGIFVWKSRPDVSASTNTRMVGKVAGGLTTAGYVGIKIGNVRDYAHRLAWQYMTGTAPTSSIDHRDGNPQNNAWANLREATISQNNMNKGPPKNSLTGYKGIYWHRKARKWLAQIVVNRKNHYLGLHDTPEAAHAAYCEAAARLHGEFARTA